MLQGGDCAESFAEFSANNIRDTFRVLLQMAVVLTFGAASPVVKVGRMAGQFAKPRSAPTETIGGVELPSYRGDIINGIDFTPARVPDPERLLLPIKPVGGDAQPAARLRQGGFADLHRSSVNAGFRADSPLGHASRELADRPSRIALLHGSLRADLGDRAADPRDRVLHQPRGAAARIRAGADPTDSLTGKWWYGCSAHMLWIGDRTRNLDGAMSSTCAASRTRSAQMRADDGPDDLLRLIDALNPQNEPGRLTLIARMGRDKVGQHLPKLIRAVRAPAQGGLVLAIRMHGNTIKSSTG